jgi:glycosyltransferase involved in cell wall biosynthesis
VFASCGGAGAQAEFARRFPSSLRPHIQAGRLRLALLAGTRPSVARGFEKLVARHDLTGHAGVRVVAAADLDSYFRVCNALLAEADVLWTKPSELTFFAALGLPLVLSPAVGIQEVYNRRWAIENGAGVPQRATDAAGDWLAEWIDDGTLAGAAWNGFTRLPKRGLYRILRALERAPAAARPSEARSPAAPASRWDRHSICRFVSP